MFDLEQQIADWRQEMFSAGIQPREVQDELEAHLREDVERQIQSGAVEQSAFEAARQGIGEAALLKTEFNKIKLMKWNRPLAGSAWALFAVSFFLPVMSGMRGWMCAVHAAMAPFYFDSLWDLHYLFLTLANLFMIASPVLLFKFSDNARVWKGVQFANIAVFVAVWSFFACLLISGWQDIKGMQVGYYAWTLSFLLLFLSSIPWPLRKPRSVVPAN